MPSSGPASAKTSWPLCASHIFAMVLLIQGFMGTMSVPLAEKMRRPSGLKTAELTRRLCPSSTKTRSAGCGVPNPYGFVGTAGDNSRSVRTECHGIDAALVPLQLQQFSGVFGIPHYYRPVRAAGDDSRTVGTESKAQKPLVRAANSTQLLTGFDVPDNGRSLFIT